MSDWQHRIKRPQLTIDEILMQLEFCFTMFMSGRIDKGLNALRYLYLELKDRQ